MKPELATTMQSAIAAMQKRSSEFEAMLDLQPRVRRCDAGHDQATLNREESFNLGRPVYHCADCEEQNRSEKVRERKIRWGMPLDVLHASFENFDVSGMQVGDSMEPRKMRDNVESFFLSEYRNLVLCGTPGIGKGHLVAAGLNCQEPTFRWITCHRFFQAIHESYAGPCPESVITYYARPAILILDEAAMSEMPKDGARSLYDLIDARHKAKLGTIVISNRKPPVVRGWLTPPIVDRLRTGGVRALWGEWPSKRGSETDF